MKLYLDASIESILSQSLAEVVRDDVSLVFIEARSADSPSRSQRGGLDIALELAKAGEKVLMIGWDSPSGYANDKRWHACLALPTLDFQRLPLALNQIAEAVIACPANTRPADPLALQLLDLKYEADEVGKFKHDLSHFEQWDRQEQKRFLKKARGFFGCYGQNELFERIRKAMPGSPISRLAGESFPDVFVDIEGTLVKQGEINTELVQQLLSLAAERPVTIWTGGDPAVLSGKLHCAGIPYKVASKGLFKGLTVKMAFDDLPYERFQQLYGIEVDEYIRV